MRVHDLSALMPARTKEPTKKQPYNSNKHSRYTYVVQTEIKVSRFTNLKKNVSNLNKQESVSIAFVFAGPEG